MKMGKRSAAISTFLGPMARIEGVIEFEGTIRLDGTVEGEIRSKEGTVIIGEKAVIRADINVGVAIIMGEVKGSIEAASRIEVYPPGRVYGDILAPEIAIAAGVVFNGNCAMKDQAMEGRGRGLRAVREIELTETVK